MSFTTFRLGLRRRRSDEDYRALQHHLAQMTVADLSRRGIDVAASSVLEVGAGRGGFSEVLAIEARRFVASDRYRHPFFDGPGAPTWMLIDLLEPMPLEDNSFDLIIATSVIEHLPDPRVMLREAQRVLKPGGKLLVSFPPFWSLWLVGGHQYKPFHFLGESIATMVFSRRANANVTAYSDPWGDAGPLYPLTISAVKAAIGGEGFRIVDSYSRGWSKNPTRLPGRLSDLLTLHACILAESSTNS